MNNQPTRLIIKKGDYNETLGGFASTIGAYPNPNLKWEKHILITWDLILVSCVARLTGHLLSSTKKTKDAFLSKRWPVRMVSRITW